MRIDIHPTLALAWCLLSTAACSTPPTSHHPRLDSALARSPEGARSLFEEQDGVDADAQPQLRALTRASSTEYASGFAIAIYGVHHSVGGDFDGQTVVVSPSDVTVLPDLDAGLGAGASFGLKTPGGGFELYVESADFGGDFGGLDVDASMINIGLRGRLVPGRFDSPQQRWQPYFLAGLALALLTVEDGSTDGAVVDDGEFTGFSCELGVGGLVNLSKHFALRLDLGYRWTEFTSVDSVAFSGTIDDGVGASGLWSSLGLVATF